MSRKGRQGRRSSGGGPSAKRANGSRWGSPAPPTSGAAGVEALAAGQSGGLARDVEPAGEPPQPTQAPEPARQEVASAETETARAPKEQTPTPPPAVPSEDS